MEYRKLGATGVEVSKLTLGAMMFGAWGNPDHADGIRIIHAALDVGINVVDTADVYSQGENEEIVGKALAGRRDEVVLATKFHGKMGDGPNRSGNSRRWIVQEVEASLTRLNTDWIDIYQAHRSDPQTDIDETLGALTDLVRQGKVRYLGVSTGHASDPVELQWSGWRMVESLWVGERKGSERFISTQPPYSIFSRDVEREIFPVCERFGFGAIVWSPLEGGWLAGRYRKGQPPPPDSRAANDTEFGHFVRDNFTLDSPRGQQRLEIVDELVRMADELNVSLAAYATAWVLRHQAVSAAIVGPRVSRHLDASFEALGVRIPDAHLARIDELVAPGSRL